MVHKLTLDSLKNSSITKGEFSVYVEFTSVDNLAVPFCAVTSEVVSRNTFDIVHTYGRALECSEFGSKIDYETSFETGWCIWNFGNQFKNHCVSPFLIKCYLDVLGINSRG